MKRILLLSVPLAALFGCASHHRLSYDEYKPEIHGAQERRDSLVGNWYGEAISKNGVQRRWINRRSSDGSYIIEMKIDDPSSEQPDREYGVWGMSGPVYFTMMRGWLDEDGEIRPSDPSDANFYDAYEIVQLTADAFTYRGLETGNVFTTRRVADDFSL